MELAVAFAHTGIVLRSTVIGTLVELGQDVLDPGADQPLPTVDYPDTLTDRERVIPDSTLAPRLGVAQ